MQHDADVTHESWAWMDTAEGQVRAARGGRHRAALEEVIPQDTWQEHALIMPDSKERVPGVSAPLRRLGGAGKFWEMRCLPRAGGQCVAGEGMSDWSREQRWGPELRLYLRDHRKPLELGSRD